jgi:hypothetical protein
MQLTQYIGDSTSHEIPLTWAGDNFTPGEAWSLIFTAKRSAQDSDDAAVFQKVTGAGISVTGNTAEVEIVPADTLALPSATYIWDIQAQSLSTGEVRTVALGGIKLVRDVTRKTTSSVEIHTIEPGVPFRRGRPSRPNRSPRSSRHASTHLHLLHRGGRPLHELLTPNHSRTCLHSISEK